jgi:hypothetical protein
MDETILILFNNIVLLVPLLLTQTSTETTIKTIKLCIGTWVKIRPIIAMHQEHSTTQ